MPSVDDLRHALGEAELRLPPGETEFRRKVIAEAEPPGYAAAEPPLDPRRAAVLEEARGWLGTPYHHMGRIKGAGIDCLTLLAEVYAAAGVIAPVVDLPFYRPDFMFHSELETYLNGLLEAGGRPVEAPLPGDVAIFRRFDWRIFGHTAIVVAWPDVIHAVPGQPPRHGCSRADASSAWFRQYVVKFLSPFAAA